LEVHLRETPTLRLFFYDGIVAAGGHVVLKSTHYIAAGGHVGRKSHHILTSQCDWRIIFLRLNSAHYHGNGNAAGSGRERRWISGWNKGAAVRVGVGATLEAFSRDWVELRL